MTKKNYIMSLLVASIVLGAGVFGYVKHQKSVEVDTSIAAIIVANSVTANPARAVLTCYNTWNLKRKTSFLECSFCSRVSGKKPRDSSECD